MGSIAISRNPQYTSSIIGLVGLAICANSWLTLPLAALMSGAYVLMALVEEAWLERHYGAPYREYCERTARFLDVQELLALIERKKPSGRRAERNYSAAIATRGASPATMRRAASSTSSPAPSRCAFSARCRRNARARGCPWNSPRICRVI